MKSCLIVLCALLLNCAVRAENATVAGEVTTPYPTIMNLAVEWAIKGDDNLNGVVGVRYRSAGADKWNEAMPLRRVPAGVSQTMKPDFHWANRHSGSILDLKPNTEYEIELKLSDPEGGNAEKTVKARTRSVPRAAADAPVRNLTPQTFDDLKPGEIGLLAPGNYGEVTIRKDGQPGKPLVYRSVTGDAVFAQISMNDRKYVYLEGLTVKNPAKDSAAIKMNLAEHCVVRRCKINTTYGIRAGMIPGIKNCYIADNTIEGVTPWTKEAMGASGKNIGEGIEITGPGNVICFNSVKGHRDCISHYEQTPTEQICNDIYNNEVAVGADDGIEADFAHHNCRIMRNRLTNCFVGLSSQPGFGGPTYFIRNVMYNLTYAPFKLHRFSKGDVVLHNTVVKAGDGMACFSGAEFDYAFFRNNLCIGGPNGGEKWGGYGAGDGCAAAMCAPGPHCSFDYDALGSHQTPFKAIFGKYTFTSIEALTKSAFEPHGVPADINVFSGVEFPVPCIPERKPADLRPRAESAVVDAALRLPNVNDNFLGKGPDIGAYEAGQPLPHYGPRPDGVDEETPAKDSPAVSAAADTNSAPVVASNSPAAREAAPAIDANTHRTAVQTALQDKSAKLGGKVNIDVMGKRADVVIKSADKNGIVMTVTSNDLPARWKDISDQDLARIALQCCDENAQALFDAGALAVAACAPTLAEKIVDRMLTIDQAKALALDKIVKAAK
jgi:hypothetical protein